MIVVDPDSTVSLAAFWFPVVAASCSLLVSLCGADRKKKEGGAAPDKLLNDDANSKSKSSSSVGAAPSYRLPRRIEKTTPKDYYMAGGKKSQEKFEARQRAAKKYKPTVYKPVVKDRPKDMPGHTAMPPTATPTATQTPRSVPESPATPVKESSKEHITLNTRGEKVRPANEDETLKMCKTNFGNTQDGLKKAATDREVERQLSEQERRAEEKRKEEEEEERVLRKEYEREMKRKRSSKKPAKGKGRRRSSKNKKHKHRKYETSTESSSDEDDYDDDYDDGYGHLRRRARGKYDDRDEEEDERRARKSKDANVVRRKPRAEKRILDETQSGKTAKPKKKGEKKASTKECVDKGVEPTQEDD